MKMLNIVTHVNMQHQLADTLQQIEQVSGFTFSPAQGHGSHAGSDPFLSGRDRVVGYTPRIRVEVLLADDAVAAVLGRLRESIRHGRNQGVYWIHAVDESGSL